MSFIVGLFRKEYALLTNDDGLLVATKKIKLTENMFKWKDKTYNVLRNKAHRDTISKWGGFVRHYRYHYNINNPNPFSYNKDNENFEPLIEPDVYNRMLEAEILKSLNKVPFQFLKSLSPTQIVMGLIVVIVGYYIISTGSLF